MYIKAKTCIATMRNDYLKQIVMFEKYDFNIFFLSGEIFLILFPTVTPKYLTLLFKKDFHHPLVGQASQN